MTIAPVGPIVGPISPLLLGVASSADVVGDGTDFAIGGLRFKVAASDERPYERATAQFRKDQFDTSTTAGDQSLTGWWTRGQLSFHHGAGVKYYEVAEGETVIDRFYDGENVDPWTAGQVTLAEDLESLAFTGAQDAVYVGSFSTPYFLVLKTDGTLSGINGTTDLSTATASVVGTTTGGTSRAITGSQFNAYVANNMNIEKYAAGDATTATLWTLTEVGGVNLVGLWYMKHRLWAVSGQGRWAMLSTAGGTQNMSTTYDFTIPERGYLQQPTPWAACETPGPVLIGEGPRIWAVTVDEQATTPKPSAPVKVADLPNDETITALNYHVGSVVITTNKGVRFAAVTSSGEVVYGPLVVEGDFSSTRHIGRRGSKAYATGTVNGLSGAWGFDLANTISDLVPAYVRKLPLPAVPVYGGLLESKYGLLLWSSGAGSIWRTSATKLATTGQVTTGYHRFNTLEPKKYDQVKVRANGTGGTIAVARVMADGSTVSLYTFDLDTSDGEDITLGLAEPIEMVGLKFTLTRDAGDATKGPILLGYQLRALPAPKRQRMIRVPLECFDVERRGGPRAIGYKGSAWDRLSVLEDMERTGGTFTFQDFRTGEAGECQIESVEFQNKTPPGKQTNGFGGVVFVTLRKLA